jgi:hypothetical protein
MIRTILCLAAAGLFAFTAWTFGAVPEHGWVVDGFPAHAAIRVIEVAPKVLASCALLSAAAADWAWVARTFRV